MVVTIVYNEQFSAEAHSLKKAVKDEWSNASVNMMRTPDTFNGVKYQVQLHSEVIHKSNNPASNSDIINLIEEKL